MSESTRTIARFQYFQDKVCERKRYWHGNGFVLLETHFRKRANSFRHKDSSSLLYKYLTVGTIFSFKLLKMSFGFRKKKQPLLALELGRNKIDKFL